MRRRLRLLVWGRQARFRRRLLFLRRTGLPPPDDRGFVPRRDGDERPGCIDRAWEKARRAAEALDSLARRDYVRPYPHSPTWSLPARPDDASPSWDNVVRALEEDR
jgi:hypothetical protein